MVSEPVYLAERFLSDEDLPSVQAQLVERVQETIDTLGFLGRATIQGSTAKGTYLDASDIDLFILFDPHLQTIPFEHVARHIAEQTFGADAVFTDKHATHPYVRTVYQGYDVDIVPAYDVPPDRMISDVDRTPHHTEWVNEHLSETQKDEVRITKLWLKQVGLYGSDSWNQGFSGYSIEVLMDHCMDFYGFLSWVVRSPLEKPVVFDPVDPGRDVLACVSNETWDRFIEMLDSPRSSRILHYFPEFDLGAFRREQLMQIQVSADNVEHAASIRSKYRRFFENSRREHGFELDYHFFYEDDMVTIYVTYDLIGPTRTVWGPPAHMKEAETQFLDKHETLVYRDMRNGRLFAVYSQHQDLKFYLRACDYIPAGDIREESMASFTPLFPA